MKTKQIKLDVDYIGGTTALTIVEEQALSEYFKKAKEMPETKKKKKAKPIKN